MTETYTNNLFVCTLAKVEVGQNFEKLPLHVTIQPWFLLPVDRQRSLLNGLQNLLYRTSQISIVGAEETNFGPDKDSNPIPVRKVRSQGDLERLHSATGELIRLAGGIIDSPFVGEEYSPHVTFHGEEGLCSGEKLKLNALQWVSKDPGTRVRTIDRILYFQDEKK